jgi:Secretory lipase
MLLRRSCLFVGILLAGSATIVGSQPVGAAASRALPTKDPFYRYSGSKPLATIAPGTVLKKRVVSVSLSGSATPISADQLLYRTKNEQGKPSVTVTTVLKPPTAAVTPHLLAYLSFYDALGSECDPSYTLAGGDPGTTNQQQANEEEALIGSYLTQGDIVTIPDFEGEKLDWASGQEAGAGTLDSIRATESDLGLPRSTAVGLSGYSGGAIAADWASELAPHYAPGLNIVGVAEGGIPVDFAHNTRYINGSQDWSGVIPAVLVSLTRAFDLKLSRYLSAKGRRITHQVRNECIGSFLGSYPGLTIKSLLKPRYKNFLAIPVFARIANKLLMGSTKGHPKGPLFMAVGNSDSTGDGVMVTKDVEALAHEYCKQGVQVQFTVYKGANHTEAALPFEGASSEFLQERFAGTPFVNGCSSIGKGNSLKPLPVHKHHKK